MTSPADPGMQAERTSLAWRRTALSVAVGSLAGMRVLPPHLGVIGWVAALLGTAWSVDLAVTAVRRYRQADLVLRSRGARAIGPTIARTAATTLACGALGLACVVVIAVG